MCYLTWTIRQKEKQLVHAGDPGRKKERKHDGIISVTKSPKIFWVVALLSSPPAERDRWQLFLESLFLFLLALAPKKIFFFEERALIIYHSQHPKRRFVSVSCRHSISQKMGEFEHRDVTEFEQLLGKKKEARLAFIMEVISGLFFRHISRPFFLLEGRRNHRCLPFHFSLLFCLGKRKR